MCFPAFSLSLFTYVFVKNWESPYGFLKKSGVASGTEF